MVREHAPNMKIHVSTQANNTNWMSVKTWKDMGAKRVILAREMSLKEIKTIREKVPDVEIEVFIHGAMCMAYSGRCLLSNYFTNRDANRGICAQDCRWNYKVIAEGHEETGAHDIVENEEGTYMFNAKDLCSIEFIDKIIEWSKQKNELKVVDDQFSSPTYSKDLAYFSWELIKKECESGIYHFTNDGIASKYDQAQYILEKISWKGDLIRAKSEEFNLLAERPKFSKLSCKKIKEKLGVSIPNWKDAIDRYLKENNK